MNNIAIKFFSGASGWFPRTQRLKKSSNRGSNVVDNVRKQACINVEIYPESYIYNA